MPPERRPGFGLLLLALVGCFAGCDELPVESAPHGEQSAVASGVAQEPGSLPSESRELLEPPRMTDGAAAKTTGWVQVPLVLSDPAGLPPGPQVMQSHALSPEGEGWRLDAPGSRLVRTRDGPALELGAGRPDQSLVAELPGSFPVQTVDRVVVSASFRGSGQLVASLLRNGKVLLSSAPTSLPQQEDVAAFSLDLHLTDGVLPPGALPADTLRLECTGGFRRLVLTSVELQRVSLSSILPDPRNGPDWVTVGDDSRPALGLHQSLPLRGEVDVPPNGLLDLSLAAVGLAGGVRLVISDGSRQEQHGLALPGQASDWSEFAVPLSSWAGRKVTIALHWDQNTAAIVGPVFVGAAQVDPETMVLVTSGSHRGDHLGLAFRGIDIDTPNLDSLARRGVLFTDAHAVTNAPTLALAALHTGRTPRDTGLLSESDRLAEVAPTLAERLSAAGWRCESVLATRSLRPVSRGLGQGFHVVEAPQDSWRWDAAEVVRRAGELLAAADDRPLFLWLHLADGQWPHEPPDGELSPYYRVTDDPRHEGYKRPKVYKKSMPLPYRDVRDLSWARARYKASLTALDGALGDLFEEPRVAAGTTVFMGAQGLGLGEHSFWFKHGGLYPSVLHVPLIVAQGHGSASERPWPAGLRCAAPVSTLGLAATLALSAGVSPVGWQGDDLLAVANGELQPGPRFAVEDHAQSAAVTSEGMHLIVSLQNRNSGHLVERRELGELELYDLTEDWKGEVPLSMEDDESASKALGLLLLRWLSEAQDLNWDEPGVLDDARRAHLDELGYVGTPPRTPDNPWSTKR